MSAPKSVDFLTDPNALSLSKKIMIGVILALPILAVVIYGLTRGDQGVDGRVVDWAMYREFDPQSNQMPNSLKALDGQKIRSPGFMVPLEDNRAQVYHRLPIERKAEA